jgi:acyl-CoA thioester hydrolase
MSADRPPPAARASFPHWLQLQTRWMDNDAYGHVNNAVYYSYFDTLVNRFLIDAGGFDLHHAPAIGYAVETMCRFHGAFVYPEPIDAGLRIGHLGRSSVRYEIGLFRVGEDIARADGHFVHVFVDRTTEKPTLIPASIRAAFERNRAR